uniref:Snake toxin/toxin-like domain-containing protein n=1 Tax=Acrobeloides nanus TaxID=290746 RepID=A0A914CFZ1_9BILA
MLLFFVVTIATSSAIRCYVCETYGNGNPATPQECPAGQDNCALIMLNNGNIIYRGCHSGFDQSHSPPGAFNAICGGDDLCNSGGGGYC